MRLRVWDWGRLWQLPPTSIARSGRIGIGVQSHLSAIPCVPITVILLIRLWRLKSDVDYLHG